MKAAKSNRKRDPDSNYRERVYRIVRSIPRGRVMTYGQLAEILGEGYTPRTIGFVMHGSDDKTPWHRVINAQGGCSTGRLVLPADKQQRMLAAEGVEFNERGRCDLQRYLWIPRERKTSGKSSQKNKNSFAKSRTTTKRNRI
ncbi:MAG TPA: MGMT family protein [Pyrinomonadaceae bacterium]|nr:MGMT family protein [Pyrinomonadaceae bacterium]